MTYRKKLIEVALPLEEINKQSAREKSIRHGHPSTLHLWWARRPLAACRAVLFASLVDDPSEYMPNEQAAHDERERLFRLIEQLVNWDNLNDEKLFVEARLEIARSVARNLGVDVPVGDAAIREFLATKAPPVLDPFAGGGSIPLEAQRLGLRAYASDLNPVAVLINKALIEIPPRFANRPPVHPETSKVSKTFEVFNREWRGAQGLAEDVRYYGKWMRDEAEKRIGHLYPKVKLPKEYGGGEATVIAWLWARTVKCPNPACGATMPLVRSFWLSTKKGKQAWVQPIVDNKAKAVSFGVKIGEGKPPDGTVNRRGASCLCCGTPVSFDHIRAEGKSKRIGAQLMSIVVEGKSDRVYQPPIAEHEAIVNQPLPANVPDTELPEQALGFRVQLYGMSKHRDLFTARQLIVLTTFSDLIETAKAHIEHDAVVAGLANDHVPLSKGGAGAAAYANAIAVYLAFAVDKMTTTNCSLCTWQTKPTRLVAAFSRQTVPMVWDYAEANPFSETAGDYRLGIGSLSEVIERLAPISEGVVRQADATAKVDDLIHTLVSTDPPYYDNIGYADLSDYFYLWLRRSLSHSYPELFNTMLVPKSQELVATPFRFDGDREKARDFFEDGLALAFRQMREIQCRDYPLSVFYAFKQSESEVDEDLENGDHASTASTGWETMLEGLVSAGFAITGTWPVHTELTVALKATVSALASSIVLICRPRVNEAPVATRREFIAALKRELPPALKELQQGYIAPVDLAQATIGPGMAVFSRFSQVLDADGSPMRVRAALALINQTLDEFLTEQEGEFDADTRWALAWFEQFGHNEGPFGDAETLSKAKNTSVNGLVHAGILEARAGKVRLLKRDELDADWTPEKDDRRAVWEAAQYLIRALDEGGEQAAADLLRRLGSLGETARDLAYRLYSICERKGWASDALAYNMLAAAWPRLTELAARSMPRQDALL